MADAESDGSLGPRGASDVASDASACGSDDALGPRGADDADMASLSCDDAVGPKGAPSLESELPAAPPPAARAPRELEVLHPAPARAVWQLQRHAAQNHGPGLPAAIALEEATEPSDFAIVLRPAVETCQELGR